MEHLLSLSHEKIFSTNPELGFPARNSTPRSLRMAGGGWGEEGKRRSHVVRKASIVENSNSKFL